MWHEVDDVYWIDYSVCGDCGSLVNDGFKQIHEQFHTTLEEFIRNIK